MNGAGGVGAGRRDRIVFAAAVAVGACTWLLPAWSWGVAEAWDLGIYWSLVVPAMYAACVALGYFGARAAWRWPLVLFGAHFVAMFATRPGLAGASMLPLGVALLAVMALVGEIPAYVGVALRRIVSGRRGRGVPQDGRS